jgi:hypothetical protein
VRLVADEGDDHAVEVEEEHEQVETELDEGFLCGVSSLRQCVCMRTIACKVPYRDARLTFLCTLSFLKISVASSRCWFSKILPLSALSIVYSLFLHILLCVPGQQRQVQDERHPVTIDQKQNSQESVYGSFGDDVGVEAVTEIDRVDVIAAAKLACVLEDDACLDSRAARSAP